MRTYKCICGNSLMIVICGILVGWMIETLAQPIKAKKTYADLVVGYAGIEGWSDWRNAQNESFEQTAKQLNITLKVLYQAMKQEWQIKAVQEFITQGSDVIGVSPIVQSGWQRVFQEAQDAGIPIILVDRYADVPENQYATFIGYDFVHQGEQACSELARLLDGRGNLVELEGTIGSGPANERQQGFRNCLKAYPELSILASQSADFTRAKGKEVMKAFLKEFGRQITGLYAHNDDMAMGAIKAIEEYGLKPGRDIKIVSIDGMRSAFEAMVSGKLNTTIETNPQMGPLFFEIALKVVNGEEVPKFIPVPIRVFRQEDAARELPHRKY